MDRPSDTEFIMDLSAFSDRRICGYLSRYDRIAPKPEIENVEN